MAATALDFPSLQCIVCPKNPCFSDVSHLLTHVASKGHLSQYYKLKVRSSHDDNAMGVIEAFDSWYANCGIEQLMSERMHSKERKQPRLGTLATQVPRRRISVGTHLSSFPASSATNLPSVSKSTSLTSLPYPKPVATRSHRPHWYLWSTTRPKLFNPQILESSSPTYGASLDLYPAAPVAKMWGDVSAESATMDVEDEEGAGGEMTKLKGVFWPGMDIFDAATPVMKRKRNQKKDTSVAVQLERQSILAEPTEMIFTPFGSWRKTRVITGQPDFNSSPDRLSPPVMKPRRRQPNRQPLARKDSNVAPRSLNRDTPSPCPFPGYDRAMSNPRGNTGSNFKHEQEGETISAEALHQSALSTGMRYLTTSLHLPQQSGLESRSLAPSTLLDINTGALYHNNFFADAFESYHPTLVGLPYYGVGYYGQAPPLPPGFCAHSSTNYQDEEQLAGSYVHDDGSNNGDYTVSAKSED